MIVPDDIRHMTVEDAMCRLGAKLPQQCEHIKANGEFCGSPALRNRNYCYFHLTQIGRRLRTDRAYQQLSATTNPDGRTDAAAANVLPDLPPLEDANSVQVALMQVLDAILHNRIDCKRAGLLLYGLQTASSNLRNGANFSQASGVTTAGGYEAFEQDYELDDDAPELKLEDQDEEEENNDDTAEEEENGEKQEPAEAAECEGAEDELDKEGNEKGELIEHCSNLNQFFCSIMGPLAQKNGGGVVQTRRSQREVASQRIVRKGSTRTEEEVAA